MACKFDSTKLHVPCPIGIRPVHWLAAHRQPFDSSGMLLCRDVRSWWPCWRPPTAALGLKFEDPRSSTCCCDTLQLQTPCCALFLSSLVNETDSIGR